MKIITAERNVKTRLSSTSLITFSTCFQNYGVTDNPWILSGKNKRIFLTKSRWSRWEISFRLMPERSCKSGWKWIVEGIKWAPGLFSSRTFTWLFLWYILKWKFDQNHPVPCITLVEFLPPSTPLGCGKVCIEIKEEKDCNSGGGSKWDDSGISRCSLRIFIKL